MARTINKLSAAQVAKATKPGLYGDGLGLWLQVGPTGAKSWCLRYMITGKARQMGLGDVNTFGLKEARDRARAARQQVQSGIDPIEERKAIRDAKRAEEAKQVTFEEATKRLLAAKAPGWKGGKSEHDWRASLTTYAFPVIGKLSVAKVETAHVIQILEPIWNTKNATASRVRERIEAVLNWAKAHHLRTGENPASWKGRLDSALAAPGKVSKTKHRKALPYDDISEFMPKLRSLGGISARALEFTILTASRPGEVFKAKADEIDLHAGVWIKPPEHMKSGIEHRVPLSGRAIEILKSVPKEEGNKHLFAGARRGKGLSEQAMIKCLRSIKGHGDLDVHGFRSTFRDWAGDATSFQREVIEQALAHQLKDKVEAAYRRSDALEKRRRLMDAWAGFCSRPPAVKGDNVTALVRSA
ncbi:MAG: integrase arm-type DNA-binding domain-containing protein [Bosea sp.]|uniref:tyrosine-type recombinase/integrase n=1 Tax=Bosea sp. (in: a-proteobacteria) TaxID=1871050 RepID=UPI001AD1583C|nr:site-specific integrase [Bosea sp. (in: a-proteobacteria)]MBN9452930.1 integrase arm-type DNA-binding domain-containing protein [Bosea sp. (in: a-proteobacteria)]